MPNIEMDLDFYRRQFITEAKDILDGISDDILKTEADPDNRDRIDSIFRGIHTIKGSAGSFDLLEISQFAHHIENVLSLVRDRKLTINPELIDVVLNSVDTLNAMILGIEKKLPIAIDNQLVDKLTALTLGINNPSTDGKLEPAPITPTPYSLSENDEVPNSTILRMRALYGNQNHFFKIRLNYSDEFFANGYDPAVFLSQLMATALYYEAIIPDEKIADLDEFNPFHLSFQATIFLVCKIDEAAIKDLLFDPSLADIVDIAEQIQFDPDEKEIEISVNSINSANLKEFIVSSQELLSILETSIVELEKKGSQESIQKIFRALHTLKGDCSYINLSEMAQFLHNLESLFDLLRRGEVIITPKITDIALQSVDTLKIMLNVMNHGGGKLRIGQIEHAVGYYLRIFSHPSDDNRDKKSAVSFISEDVRTTFLEQSQQYREIIRTHGKPASTIPESKRITLRALKSLKSASEYMNIKTLPALVDKALIALEDPSGEDYVEILDEVILFLLGLTSEPRKLGEILIEEGLITESILQSALGRQKRLGEILIENGLVSEEDLQRSLHKQELMELGKSLKSEVLKEESEIRTMRVDERKIDVFSNLIGELVVARNTYEYIIHELTQSNPDATALIRSFKDNLHLISRISNNIQTGMMAMRMTPIKGIFQKFQRVVRDIARKQKKQIEFLTYGNETEIDKKVADTLSDPLIHIIRNACDHGIESPEERIAAHKDEKGTIILKAEQEGRNLIISIIDDGRGLDRQRILEKARAMNIPIKSEEDDSIFNIIFMAGFSTKQQITDISGRGVGMDVVQTSIKALGGEIRVHSQAGQGTNIALKIPMAMGISSALMVKAGKNIYAIPFDYVLEMIKIKAAQIHHWRERSFIHYREQVIPIERLETLLQTADDPSSRHEGDEIPIVILKTQTGKFGVRVDKLENRAEIAIKPLPEQMVGIRALNGVCLLGNGQVVLVLNPEELV